MKVPQGPQAGQQQEQPKTDDLNDANYDEWAGYGGSLFSEIKDDAEDREAEKSFAKVEDYMDGRRKKKREEKARELSLKYAQE